MFYELFMHVGRRMCVGYIIIMPIHEELGWRGSLPTAVLCCLV